MPRLIGFPDVFFFSDCLAIHRGKNHDAFLATLDLAPKACQVL